MKVRNENVNERPVAQMKAVEQEAEHMKLGLYLAENDVYALKYAQSHYGFSDYEETIRKLIEERHLIPELVISKTGRNVNHGHIYFKTDVVNQLLSESQQLGVNAGEYIRGIIYTRSQQLMQERNKKLEEQAARRHDARVITVSLEIDKKLREKLYSKYGKVTDKKLQELAREEALKALGE